MSKTALIRHRDDHLAATLSKAQDAIEVAQADSLLDQVRSIQRRTLGILDQAEDTGRLGTAVMAIREARGNLELLAKLVGELDDRPQVNVLIAPEWISLRTRLLEALRPYPEARIAVLAAIS